MSATFAARYHGTCGSCEEHISPGDDVRFEDDELVHVTCAQAQPRRPERPVCPACWLVHAGECDR